MPYAKGYFDLQLKFAHQVSSITDRELPEILLTYTSFYKTFAIQGWSFDEYNPVWLNYLRLLGQSNQPVETTYQFYLNSLQNRADSKHQFGCFSYEMESDETGDYIQIHFKNTDDPHPGTLSKERIPQRLKELKGMFIEIQDRFPNVPSVAGFSWLYNLDGYKRLFPPEYTSNSKVITDWFRSSALWGQFLDSAGELKQELVDNFLNSIRNKRSLQDLLTCFPYSLLEVEGNIADFYRFYNI